MCPKIIPNLSELPPQMSEGEHVCKIISSEHKIKSQNGTASIQWKLQNMTDGWHFIYFTDIEGKNAWAFKRFVHAAGEKNYLGGEFDTDILIGRYVRCRLAVEDGYYKVKKVSEVDVPKSSPTDEIF